MNSKAVRALRKKFIFIAMLAIAFVIFFLVMLLNVTNYVATRREIRQVLELMCEQYGEERGTASMDNDTGRDYSTDSKALEKAASAGWLRDDSFDLFALFTGYYRDVSSNYYERVKTLDPYFAVLLNQEGNVLEILPSDISEESAKVAAAFAEQTYDEQKEFGNNGGYYYLMKETRYGSVVSFFDGSAQITAMHRLLYASIVICMGILIIVFWPVYFFSDRMIQPELRNIERQKQFITNASHELKTPLAVIRANTELVELMNGESEWTTSTLRQVDRMNGLIKNLVTIARAEEKADKTALAEVDVSAAVKDTADTFAPVATQNGKELVQEIEENVRLVADEAAIRQLASLLLDNAIKYCDEGGKVTAQLSRRGKAKGIRLVVSNDYAAGANVDYSRFFERFYREDSSHNTEKGGYGIGLSIAESIVSSYNGSISASWKNGMISFTCVLL